MGYAAGIIRTQLAIATVSESTAVPVETVAVSQSHPLTSLFGKYKDEPLWEGFEEAIQKLRDEDSRI
jgi:hypothetical protein